MKAEPSRSIPRKSTQTECFYLVIHKVSMWRLGHSTASEVPFVSSSLFVKTNARQASALCERTSYWNHEWLRRNGECNNFFPSLSENYSSSKFDEAHRDFKSWINILVKGSALWNKELVEFVLSFRISEKYGNFKECLNWQRTSSSTSNANRKWIEQNIRCDQFLWHLFIDHLQKSWLCSITLTKSWI